MKIRTVERDDRTNIRRCEECKESGKEGIFLTLEFFNGFVCNDCANWLTFLIRHEGIWYEPAAATGVAESAIPAHANQPHGVPEVPSESQTRLVSQTGTFSIQGPYSDALVYATIDRRETFPGKTAQSITSRIEALEAAIRQLQTQLPTSGLGNWSGKLGMMEEGF